MSSNKIDATVISVFILRMSEGIDAATIPADLKISAGSFRLNALSRPNKTVWIRANNSKESTVIDFDGSAPQTEPEKYWMEQQAGLRKYLQIILSHRESRDARLGRYIDLCRQLEEYMMLMPQGTEKQMSARKEWLDLYSRWLRCKTLEQALQADVAAFEQEHHRYGMVRTIFQALQQELEVLQKQHDDGNVKRMLMDCIQCIEQINQEHLRLSRIALNLKGVRERFQKIMTG